jgi:hypothetical protein
MRATARVLAAAAVVALLWSLSGCATLFANQNPEVAVASDPQGAKVYINGSLEGQTPLKVRLKNDRDYTIEFRKDGYQSRTYTLGKHVGGVWIVLDILTGFWPIVIDLATGSWYELDTDNVKVMLDK